MRLIAKAALGALAMATFGLGVSAPANAARVIVTTPVITTPRVVVNPCLRAPAFRPAYCFRRDRLALLTPGYDRWTRMHMWRERERRQAFLEHRMGY